VAVNQLSMVTRFHNVSTGLGLIMKPDIAFFSRDRDKSMQGARPRLYPCDRQDRITTTAHTTSANPKASEKKPS